MVALPGGEFDGHEVTPFALDRTEVTVAAYAVCVDAGVCRAPPHRGWRRRSRANYPVVGVRWDDANAYCTWQERRLPTRWEWAWAARGRDEGRTYPWGEASPTCDRAWKIYAPKFDHGAQGCSTAALLPVGSLPKGQSRDGVLDLVGNAWEWTSTRDTEHGTYVQVGGGWASSREQRSCCARNASVLDDGFRCARELPADELAD